MDTQITIKFVKTRGEYKRGEIIRLGIVQAGGFIRGGHAVQHIEKAKKPVRKTKQLSQNSEGVFYE